MFFFVDERLTTLVRGLGPNSENVPVRIIRGFR